jgi:hypothetical protein
MLLKYLATGLCFAICSLSQPIRTFLGEDRKLLISVTEPPDGRNESVIYPTFIGVGGPKSGSTSLITSLSLHPHIELGKSQRGGQACCDNELYVLGSNNNIDAFGVTAYNKFFATEPGDTNIKAFGEKTPIYASHAMVPFKARAFLHGIKVLFTLRDSIEMDVSHFFHARKHNIEGADLTYLQWVQRRVGAQKKWNSCREKRLAEMIVPNSKHQTNWLQLKDLYTSNRLSVDIVQNIENELSLSCADHAQANNPKDPWYTTGFVPDLSGILHTENLKR